MSASRRQVAVVVGATSKWQADGRNTRLAHGKSLDDSNLPVGIRWGVGGAVAQICRRRILRRPHDPECCQRGRLGKAIVDQGGQSQIVELDLVSREFISRAFDAIRSRVGDPEAFWYLHTQDRSCWTHELQLTPFSTKPSF